LPKIEKKPVIEVKPSVIKPVMEVRKVEITPEVKPKEEKAEVKPELTKIEKKPFVPTKPSVVKSVVEEKNVEIKPRVKLEIRKVFSSILPMRSKIKPSVVKVEKKPLVKVTPRSLAKFKAKLPTILKPILKPVVKVMKLAKKEEKIKVVPPSLDWGSLFESIKEPKEDKLIEEKKLEEVKPKLPKVETEPVVTSKLPVVKHPITSLIKPVIIPKPVKSVILVVEKKKVDKKAVVITPVVKPVEKEKKSLVQPLIKPLIKPVAIPKQIEPVSPIVEEKKIDIKPKMIEVKIPKLKKEGFLTGLFKIFKKKKKIEIKKIEKFEKVEKKPVLESKLEVKSTVKPVSESVIIPKPDVEEKKIKIKFDKLPEVKLSKIEKVKPIKRFMFHEPKQKKTEITHKHLTGPVEELADMTLVDFRRLAPTTKEAIENLKEKIDLGGKDSFTGKIECIDGWRKSEPYQLYLSLSRQGLLGGISVVDAINQRKKENKVTLTREEFDSINKLSKELRY